MNPDPEAVADAYPLMFDERTRAAHIATLAFARATEPNCWPTIPMIRKFAKLFSVPASELGAFFGLMCRIESGRELWVDVLRYAPGTHEARRLMSKAQARAFGFMLMAQKP